MGQYPIHTSTTVAMFKTRVGRSIIDYILFLKGMALKKSSETIVIGARVVESAANTFTEQSVDLQLNPLDNEVFIVQAINLDASAPDAIAATDTSVRLALTTTSQTSMPTLSSSNTLALASREIRAAGYPGAGVGFEQRSMETPPAMLDYVGIISTNDFFLQIQGGANLAAKIGNVKVYGYRAKADAATYAALVQSEVLSS